jgi:hypothetical protein
LKSFPGKEKTTREIGNLINASHSTVVSIIQRFHQNASLAPATKSGADPMRPASSINAELKSAHHVNVSD